MALLAAGEGQHLRAAADLAGRRVEHEVAHLEPRLRGDGGPALQGAQAGQQLGELERLHQVVVGPGVEPLDPVGGGVAGRQHQHRDPSSRGAGTSRTTSRPERPGIRQSTTATS